MAKKMDREAMAAALGGMVSRAPAEPVLAPASVRTVAPLAPVRPVIESDDPTGEDGKGDGAYRRTGIGYVKADGTEMVRTVVMMTAAERHRLKLLAMEAGVSPSDYVRQAVGFVGEP